ncbi:MAG: hypothetical protein WCG87_00555 [Bacteroidota bacterium]
MQQRLQKLPYFLTYLLAFVFGIKQLREPDVWWQLLSGKWMLEHHAVTHSDMFSYTMAGKPWINVKWLYEIIIASIEKLTGPLGVILLQGIVNVAIAWLLIRIAKHLTETFKKPYSPFFTVLSVLLFFIISEYRMSGRPEMVSHLLCTVFLYKLLTTTHTKWKKLLWIIPLQCLWANMHDGYPVGLVMIGAYVAANVLSYFFQKEKLQLQQVGIGLLLLLAAVLVILINPNGIQLWKQPFEIYRQVWANKYTTELFSFSQAEYWTIQAKMHIAILAVIIVFWLFKILKELKQKGTDTFFTPTICSYLLMIPLFGYLSLTANRNIPFAEIILLPSVPMMFMELSATLKLNQQKVYQLLSKRSVIISSTIAVMLYVSVVSNAFYKATGSPNRYGIHISMLHNPTGAATFLKEHNIKGTGFSDYFVSSYLLWSMYPDFRSYIDLRDLDVFPVAFFDDYFSMYQHPEKFAELDKKYNFNYAVISTSQLLGLQQQLYWKEGYNMIYVDPVAAIFLKTNDANKSLNDNVQIQKLFTWPQLSDEPSWATGITKLLNPFTVYDEEDEFHSPVYAAMYYNAVNNYPLAIKILLPQMGILQDDPKANQTLSSTYAAYAKVTNDPQLKQKRADSAQYYMQQAEALKH